jgi:hypothetical protein
VGIVAAGEVATTLDDAVFAAARVGYPVAVKSADRRALHRTESGLVTTGVGSATELADVLGHWWREGPFPVVVQPMSEGTEMAIGMVRDPVLGPLVMAGAGGTQIDVWDDRAWLSPPVSAADASRAVRRLRAWRLLQGHRGGARGDVTGFERGILAVSRLCLWVPELAELDLNPVVVAPSGCAFVDAKLRLTPASGPAEGVPRQLKEVTP